MQPFRIQAELWNHNWHCGMGNWFPAPALVWCTIHTVPTHTHGMEWSVSELLRHPLFVLEDDRFWHTNYCMHDGGRREVQINIETQQPAHPHPRQGVWNDSRLMRRDEISVYGNNKDTILQQGVVVLKSKKFFYNIHSPPRPPAPRYALIFFHPSNTLPRLMSCACGSNKCYLINSIVQRKQPGITQHLSDLTKCGEAKAKLTG